jgi:zinc protease
VMNTALGGLFSSRINMNLREEHGYTYGASSAFSFRRGPGPFMVGTGVRADVTAEAVGEIIREIKRMRESDLSAEELRTAKDSIARSLPGSFETSSQTASSTGQFFVHRLAPDYYRTLPALIDAVTESDARRAAREYLRPERVLVVAVGDRRSIEPGLRRLDIGPVEICEAGRVAAE